MKYFTVYKDVVTQVERERVARDGEPIADREQIEVPIAEVYRYVVEAYTEDGEYLSTKYYKGRNDEDVLDKIEADHPADRWNNNDW